MKKRLVGILPSGDWCELANDCVEIVEVDENTWCDLVSGSLDIESVSADAETVSECATIRYSRMTNDSATFVPYMHAGCSHE